MKQSARRNVVGVLLLAVSLALVSGCERSGPAEQVEVTAMPIGHAECAACGMTVGHQPSPRAQVVHSNGTRAHLCSISELVHYIAVPSSHGRITGAFVEVMAADADPGDLSTDERPWRDVAQVSYVLGVERARIMGPPVMTYADGDLAAQAAEKLGGTVAAWGVLKAELHPGARVR